VWDGGAAMMAMAALVTLVLLVALSLAMVVLVAYRESHRTVALRATSRRRHPSDDGLPPRS
jgi:hypothetical protein